MIIKATIQSFLRSRGYRLVARNRDPQTVLEVVHGHPADAVIDVGANNGDTCVEWLKRFPNATVFGFEPQVEYAPIINEKTRRWKDRFVLFQVAASSEPGETTFHVHSDHPSSSSLLPATATAVALMPFTGRTNEISVRTDTLDRVLSNHGRRFTEAVLKLDVQGHELSVLRGATETLKAVRFVVAEVNLQPLYEGQPSFSDLNELLARRGFRFVGVAEQFHLPNGRPVFLDAVFERL